MAGRKVRALATASATTMVPASPSDPMFPRPSTSMPQSPMATVVPEKRIARPAVAMVCARASGQGRRVISSRKRLTMNSE